MPSIETSSTSSSCSTRSWSSLSTTGSAGSLGAEPMKSSSVDYGSQVTYSTQCQMSIGRPPTTTHAEIERVALDLFATRGFEATTVDDIATAVGVGRRTLFRYFESKNDLAWGDFDWVMERRPAAASARETLPLIASLRE